MAYRLYTQDVADGYTDFNDDHYHVLDSRMKADGITVALIFNDAGYSSKFVVAYGVDYHELESISWTSEVDYSDLTPAYNHYLKLSKD